MPSTKRITKTCAICGRDYQVHYGRNAETSLYCSVPCQHQGLKRHGQARREVTAEQYPGLKGTHGPVRGPCLHCGFHFRSAHVKKYCSMNCLVQTEEYQARMREQNKQIMQRKHAKYGFSSEGRLRKSCLHCGTEFFTQPKKFRSHHYCSHRCYRAFMVERFDRWIANPQSIALPQGYDEFLLGEDLPCLIQGCAWRGKNLGNHVNFTHGIVAREFKKIAGFNLRTGLVTAELSRIMGEKKLGNPAWSTHLGANHQNTQQFIRDPDYVSLEGKEHSRKAHEVLKHMPRVETSPCRNCGTDIQQPYFGQRLYCNDECRQSWYDANHKQQLHEAKCAWCGDLFKANYYQFNRQRKGLPVCCSLRCRNTRNIIYALDSRGRHLKNPLQQPEAGRP